MLPAPTISQFIALWHSDRGRALGRLCDMILLCSAFLTGQATFGTRRQWKLWLRLLM